MSGVFDEMMTTHEVRLSICQKALYTSPILQDCLQCHHYDCKIKQLSYKWEFLDSVD